MIAPAGTSSAVPDKVPAGDFRRLFRNNWKSLCVVIVLTIAAQTHANDMSDNSYFSHTDLEGGRVATRVTQTGYDWCWVGENIAYGYSTQASVFQAWMDSPGHKANMLSANPTEFGLGHASTGNYWVLVLAKPGC